MASQPQTNLDQNDEGPRVGAAARGLFLAYALLFAAALVFLYIYPKMPTPTKPLVAAAVYGSVPAIVLLINLVYLAWRGTLFMVLALCVVVGGVWSLSGPAGLIYFPQVTLIILSMGLLIFMAFAIYLDRTKSGIFGEFLAMIGLSSMVVIASSASIYIEAGLQNVGCRVEPGEALYFSTVAFSTLGFGDITPSETFSRTMAALEAVIGNVHLALFTGAAFFIISNGPQPNDEEDPAPVPPVTSTPAAKDTQDAKDDDGPKENAENATALKEQSGETNVDPGSPGEP